MNSVKVTLSTNIDFLKAERLDYVSGFDRILNRLHWMKILAQFNPRLSRQALRQTFLGIKSTSLTCSTEGLLVLNRLD